MKQRIAERRSFGEGQRVAVERDWTLLSVQVIPVAATPSDVRKGSAFPSRLFFLSERLCLERLTGGIAF
jgi:hypothetical protein